MTNDFLLIIDGSSLLSTQYYGNLPREILYARTEEERAPHYHRLMQTSGGVYTNAVFGFFKTLLSILRQQKPRYLAVCWDVTRDTFRRELYDAYKANRKETPQPLAEQFALCQQALSRIGVSQFFSPEYEADDYAGSISARLESEIPISIMTKDRDYLQLVDDRVSLWMVTSGAAKAQAFYHAHHIRQSDYIVPDFAMYLTPELVQQEFGFAPEKTVMVKQLAGDSADNIPGVKGIGEKTAIALANAYPSIEAMYDEIRELDDAQLEQVRLRWKEELGIKRSPMKYLLAHSDEELVGEAASRMSRELATIRRDILLPDLTLDSLTVRLRVEALEQVFHELEFQSLSLEALDCDFLEGERASLGTPRKVITPAAQQLEKYVDKALKQPVVSLSLCMEPVKEPVKEAEDWRPAMHIYALAFAVQEDESVLLREADGFTGEQLCALVQRFYCGSTEVIAFDVKQQLVLLNREQRDSLILKETEQMAFDLCVAAYLLNPLKAQYSPYEICLDYAHAIDNRTEIQGKEAIGELREEQQQRLFSCCAQEAQAGLTCAKALKARLDETGMWELFSRIEMPTLYTLYEMECNGVIVERQALQQYGERLMGSISELENKIYDQAGHTFNIQSPKQLGVVLFEELGLPTGKKTKTGYSTSAQVLEGLAPKYPIVQDVLNYRQLTKLHSTYAQGLAGYICADGRIHGHFNQTVTATGRISSTEPNLQNIPMRTALGREIRKVFLAAPGCVFVDADYSQIELRILAHMSDDEKLKEAYQSGQDIHALTASQVFHVPFDEVTPLMRRNAKAVNFGIVYGISAHGLSVDLHISRKEAADYMDRYFATYPGIQSYLDGMVEEGRVNGQVATLFGRIRPIPELHSTNFNQRSFGERVAMNSPIQGTAADIMKIAMIRTYRGLVREKLQSRLVLQIHDELLVETHKEELTSVQRIVREAMTGAAQLSVELSVDMNVADNWYDAK